MDVKSEREEQDTECHLTTIKTEIVTSNVGAFPVVVLESLEVKSEREELDTEGHLTTIKSEIVTSNVGVICFNALHPDWIPDRPSPQNLMIVKTEDCNRVEDDFEFPDLEHFKARKAARIKENLSSINVLYPGEKPFTCTECGKSYKLKRNFQVHHKIHTREKTHKCAKGDLLNHHKTPTDEKPYTCTECGKSFGNKDRLRKHHRVHTGEKPYTCTECGKRFGDKGNLGKHQRIHTGEKPYTCTECGKSFRQSAELHRHFVTHRTEKH
ncbi:uncharacterized protein O3C94_006283 [Discoglossus pictus]